jgi:uracil-DNA glycosylase family 4
MSTMPVLCCMIDETYHSDCQKCPVHKVVKSVGIGGNGPLDADVLVVGETLFRYEDDSNMAFYPGAPAGGAIRNITENITEHTGVKFRFTNVMRCAAMTEDHKPRVPSAKELKNCMPYLLDEIQLVNPKVVVLAGTTAVKAVLGWKTAMRDIRGRPVWGEDGRVYIPTYHPSNLIPSRFAPRAITAEEAQEMVVQDFITAVEIVSGASKKTSEVSWKLVSSEAEAMKVLADIRAEAKTLTVDFETNTYDKTAVDTIFKEGLRVLCVGLCWKKGESVVIPLDIDVCELGESGDTYFQPSESWKQAFMEALWSIDVVHQGQNYIYDQIVAWRRWGLKPKKYWKDTLYCHHLLKSHLRHDLGTLARLYTPYGGYETKTKEAVAKLPVKERGYHKIHFSIPSEKCAYDVVITDDCASQFWEQMDTQLRWIYENITIRAAEWCMAMSMNGVEFDMDWARLMATDLRVKEHQIIETLKTVQKELWDATEAALGRPLDISKPRDKIAILFAVEKLTPTKINKTGLPSVDKNVLEKLAKKSVMAYGMVMLSEIKALREKLLEPLEGWRGWDGRVHGEYKLHGTRTGRKSSAKPNMNNFPRGKNHPVKRLIKARDGRMVLYADVSQAELRVLAHITQEPYLLNAFNKGLDIHASVAAELFGIDYDKAQHDENLRRDVKTLCIAEGQSVLTDRGLVEIQNVTKRDRVWDGESFVRHDGVKFSGIKEVITYDGLTATPDHKVWTEDGEKITLSQALAEGSSLAVTGCGDMPVEYNSEGVWQYNTSRSMEIRDRVLSSLCYSQGCVCGQHPGGQSPTMPMPANGISRSEDGEASGEVRGHSPKMHESSPQTIQGLGRQGNTMPIQLSLGVHTIYPTTPSASDLRTNTLWADRQQWSLRKGESEAGNSLDEYEKHQTKCVCDVQGKRSRSDRFVRPTYKRLPGLQTVTGTHKKTGLSEGPVDRYTDSETSRPVQKVRTYDVVNAGPNRRYTVEGKLVSNSFGIIYGMTEIGLSNRIDKPLKYCKDLIDRYFARFTRVREVLFEPTKELILTQGYVRNLFGRPWHNNKNLTIVGEREAAFREGINFLIQSTSAEIVSIGISKMWDTLTAEYGANVLDQENSIALPLLEVYDSATLEVLPEFCRPVADVMKESLQHPTPMPFELTVPWVVEIKIGRNLGELETVSL